MRKLLVLVVLAGCVVIDSRPGTGSGSGSDDEATMTAAERAWLHQALPVLTQQCGACHLGGHAAPGFLAGDTVWQQRANILASGVVNFDNPAASRLITKGSHSGPGMNAPSAAAILEWVQAERDERL